MKFLLIEAVILAIAAAIIVVAVTSTLHVAVVVALIMIGAGIAIYGTFANIVGNALSWMMKNS